MNQKEFPEAIEMEKQLLSAMFMKEGLVVPEVAAIIDADDLYRPEHRLVFQAILRLYAKKQPIDYLAVEEKLRKTGDFGKIEHSYLLSLIDAIFTTARVQYHAGIIKEKANFRKIIELRAYADRLSGFDNLDQLQFFSPGLYVIGATPASGKKLRFLGAPCLRRSSKDGSEPSF